MNLQEQTMRIENGEVRFTLVTNGGGYQCPVNMGFQQARELCAEILLTLIEKRARPS